MYSRHLKDFVPESVFSGADPGILKGEGLVWQATTLYVKKREGKGSGDTAIPNQFW